MHVKCTLSVFSWTGLGWNLQGLGKWIFSILFYSPWDPSGIPEQHFATCKRFQGVPSFCGREDPEAFQSGGNVARQHREGAEERDGADREGEDAQTDGEEPGKCPLASCTGSVKHALVEGERRSCWPNVWPCPLNFMRMELTQPLSWTMHVTHLGLQLVRIVFPCPRMALLLRFSFSHKGRYCISWEFWWPDLEGWKWQFFLKYCLFETNGTHCFEWIAHYVVSWNLMSFFFYGRNFSLTMQKVIVTLILKCCFLFIAAGGYCQRLVRGYFCTVIFQWMYITEEIDWFHWSAFFFFLFVIGPHRTLWVLHKCVWSGVLGDLQVLSGT